MLWFLTIFGAIHLPKTEISVENKSKSGNILVNGTTITQLKLLWWKATKTFKLKRAFEIHFHQDNKNNRSKET